MKKRILFVICMAFATQLYADATSHKAAAMKLLESTHTANMLDGMAEQMTSMFSMMSQRPGVTPEQKKIIESYKNKATSMLQSQLAWDKLKDDFAALYMQAYTEQELNELTQFYQSPLGQKMLAKTPELMAKSMEIPQQHLAPMQSQMQQLMGEMGQALANTSKAPAAQP